MRLRFLVASFFVFALSALGGSGMYWANQTLEPGSPTEPRTLSFFGPEGENLEVSNLYGLAVRREGMTQMEYWLAQRTLLGRMPISVNTSEGFSAQAIDERANIARNNSWFAAHAIVGLPEPTQQWLVEDMIVDNMTCDIRPDDYVGVNKNDYENILNTSFRSSLFVDETPLWIPKVEDTWDEGYILAKPTCDFVVRTTLKSASLEIEKVAPGAAGQWKPLYTAENEPPFPHNIPNWKGGSLGLVYGLAYVEYLTGEPIVPKDLIVAGTGMLGVSPTGWTKIFEVESVKEKTISASWVNADVVFVPKGQKDDGYYEMKNKIIEVESLEEAVGWLCKLGSENPVCERFPQPKNSQQLTLDFMETNLTLR